MEWVIAGAAWLAALAGTVPIFGGNALSDREDERLERDLMRRRAA